METPEQKSEMWMDLWKVKEVKSIYNAGKLDLLSWGNATQVIPEAVTVNNRYQSQIGSDVVRDAFWGIYKSNPEISPSPGLEELAKIMGEAMTTPGYQNLKQHAQGNLVASAIGAMSFSESFMNVMPPELKQELKVMANEAKKVEKLNKEILDLEALIKAVTDNPEAQTQLKKSVASKRRQMRKASQVLSDAATKANDLAEESKAIIISQLNDGAMKAAQKASEAKGFINGFGSVLGEDGRADIQTAKAAMQVLRNNVNLGNLAQMLGWARKMTRAIHRKSPRMKTDMVGYKTQQDLNASHMASWEHAAMVSQDPMTKLQFITRVMDGGVYHRNFEGKEKKGRGPMIIVRDESGSMSDEPHSLAVALEWALLDIARREKRPFFSIPFSSRHHVWAADPPNMEGLMNHLSHFYGGGTYPYPALISALKLIEEGDLAADILMLTDEEFGYPDRRFLEELELARKRRPLKVIVVVIGGYSTGQAEWADKLIMVKDLVGERDKLSQAVELMV